MKKIAYTEAQVTDIVKCLELLNVRGMQQARILATIGALLDQGTEIEVEEEGGSNSEVGETN